MGSKKTKVNKMCHMYCKWFLTAVNMKIIVFWDMTLCSLVERCHCSRGACCLYLMSRNSKFLNHYYLSLRPYSITSQKTAIFVLYTIKLMNAINLLRYRFGLFGTGLNINEFILSKSLEKSCHLMFQTSCLVFFIFSYVLLLLVYNTSQQCLTSNHHSFLYSKCLNYIHGSCRIKSVFSVNVLQNI
jgi:hypothetical protein